MKLIDNSHNGVAAPKKMLFAFYPFEAHGHINPAISMGNALRQMGHDTVFLCINDIGYTDQRVICLKKIRDAKRESNNNTPKTPDFKIVKQASIDELAKHTLAEKQSIKQASVDRRMIEKMQAVDYTSDTFDTLCTMFDCFSELISHLSDPVWDEILREVLVDLKPDVVVVDHVVVSPAIMTPAHNQKWVKVSSVQPLGLYGHSNPDLFPAPYLGVSVTNSTQEEKLLSWRQYEQASAPVRPLTLEMARLAKLPAKDHSIVLPDMNISPYLNMYIYPRELDYDQELGHSLTDWVRIQSTNRPKNYNQLSQLDGQNRHKLLEALDIPQDLCDFISSNLDEQGRTKKKLLFLSMGTIACMDLNIMQGLVDLLAEQPYQVIVSKGARHQEYNLAPNMWGAKHVPQKEILLLVDLVITHGGNNTITECLYSGVPALIVCPMFCDQLDNAGRLQEKRLAVRVDLNRPNSFQTLLESIEKVLQDTEMSDNIKRVSKELRDPSDGPEKAAKLIEKLALQS